MNRRHILSAVTVTPLGIGARTVREERQALTAANCVPAHMIVSAFA